LGVPGRHRQAQHVSERAGPPVSGCPSQATDLGAQHNLWGDGTLDKREATGMVAPRRPVENEAVDKLAGETDPHAAADDDRRRELRWHQVVERAIKVRE